MGDMAEEMNALKKFHKEERQQKAEMNIFLLESLGIPAFEQSKNVFRIDHLELGTVMYYPSSNKWQHRSRIHQGNVNSFQGWLRNNKFII